MLIRKCIVMNYFCIHVNFVMTNLDCMLYLGSCLKKKSWFVKFFKNSSPLLSTALKFIKITR